LERRWTGRAGAGPPELPVRIVADAFPTVAVVGVIAPRLYIADSVLAACPAAELRAVIAHEQAHVAARDNLKRFLMRICPDAVWVRAAIERAWAEAAEECADAAATSGSLACPLDLAQALVRVARLAAGADRPALASALYPGGSIESRVRRLLAGAAEPEAPGRIATLSTAAAAALLAGAGAGCAPMLYQMVEAAVRALP
ncbi:MAG TPA: M48 family metalloprotease, partial [Vicinamibacterales bacterium]|nr:M48 family metalloprotease [Vicinamibacterales bacterium]